MPPSDRPFPCGQGSLLSRRYGSKVTIDRKLTRYDCLAPDLLLKLQHPIEQRLRGRRAAGNIDVDRHDAVAPPHHRVGIVIVAAAVGAGSHRDYPARLCHLIVDLAQGRRHLVAEGAGDDHDIRLSRTWAEDRTEAVQVIAAGGRVHHLHGTTGQAKGHGPEGPRLRPGRQTVHLSDHKALFLDLFGNAPQHSVLVAAGRKNSLWLRDHSHSSAPFLHSYTNPTVNSPRNTIIDPKPKRPVSESVTAQGNRKATSRSKMMKWIATR